MVEDAKKYEEEDRKLKERIDSRNGLESYAYSLRNTLEDKSDNIPAEDMQELQDSIDEVLDWLDMNRDAEREEYDEKKKELEQIANPIIRSMYSGGGEYDNDDMDEFDDGEL